MSRSGSGLTKAIQETDTCSPEISTTEPKDECLEVCVSIELILTGHLPCINLDSKEIKMTRRFTKSLLLKKIDAS